MGNIKFCILIVTLNAEKEICKTIDSINLQSYQNYEVIIKDGGSTDSTLDFVPTDPRYRVVNKNDISVYDGMNQALHYATGQYLIFLNAGDSFYDKDTLKDIASYIESKKPIEPCVLYGDYCRNHEYIQRQKGRLTSFLLYRRPLCHQSVLYHRDVFMYGEQYDINYSISADHDLSLRLWRKKVPFYHTGVVICHYLGGGISETKKGLKKAKIEKNNIVKNYYSWNENIVYKFIVFCSFNLVRSWIDSEKSPIWMRTIYRNFRNILLR